jgi:hypothetical protein
MEITIDYMDVTISRVVRSTMFFKTFADMMGIDLNFFVYRQPPMDIKEMSNT